MIPAGVPEGRETPDVATARARARLDRALDHLSAVFAGMTARQDEAQCTCHWGSEEDLALLKLPDRELAPALLHRTWTTVDWTDHGAVLRRILPQFARALVAGQVTVSSGMGEVGRSFARGRWERWPAPQSAAVSEFLHAWWARTLTDPEPVLPAHAVLPVCAEATGRLGPWLVAWESLRHPHADRHLTRSVAHWEYDLLGDELPWDTWDTWEDEDALRTELVAWLVRHAPGRLRSAGREGAEHRELLHRVRLMGVTGPARWEDPHWPGHHY
ncbi:hypothetical protein [Streptomyces sp. NPDC097619]|uniref:hypothetical protein n=1 Tax=Streptomyces sp. NPDC097619 TaxID=3157228 RepID=UPI00332BDEBB